MINRIESNRYTPAFGTTATEVNKLDKLVRRHVEVSPVLNDIRKGMTSLKTNGNLDDMQVKFKMGRNIFGQKFIKMVATVYDPIKSFGTRYSAKKSIKLFRVKSDAEVIKTKELEKFSENLEEILPSIHKEITADLITGVKVKQPNPFYKTHEQISEHFNAIDETFNNIEVNDTSNGLLKCNYSFTKKPENKHLSTMNLNMNVYSATLNEKGNRIHKLGSVELFDFDKDKNIVGEIKSPEEISNQIMEKFESLKKNVIAAANDITDRKQAKK